MLSYRRMDELNEQDIPVQYKTDKRGKKIGYAVPELKKTQVNVGGKTFEVSFTAFSNRFKSLWYMEEVDDCREGTSSLLENGFREDADSTEYREYPKEKLAKTDDGLRTRMWEGIYDPAKALSCCRAPEGFVHEGTGGYVTNPIRDEPADLSKLKPLTVESGMKRLHIFVSVAQRVVTEEMAKALVEHAEKKKNGTLYKSRVMPIACLNVVSEDGVVYQLVAFNESDTVLKVMIRKTDLNGELINKRERDLLSTTDLFFQMAPESRYPQMNPELPYMTPAQVMEEIARKEQLAKEAAEKKKQKEEAKRQREEARRQREEEKLRKAEEARQRREEALKLREEEKKRQEAALKQQAEERRRQAVEQREQAKAERERMVAEGMAQREQARREAAAKAEILYAPGEEPEKLRARLDTLFEKLDGAYPDKRISGLARDHKKWSETVTELYRKLGYADSHSFLEAYGYTVVQNIGGRPTLIDPDAIIEELQRRYPDGGVDKVTTLERENPDIPWKTLMNNALDYFGDSLARYLKSIGLISGK